MNYQASISDFFRAPKWKNNLLLGALAILIPMVGPLVLSGWHITCLWARGNRDEPEEFPPFDFQFFGKYLERGLWPFLVAMVASLALVPVMMALFVPFVILFGMEGSRPAAPPTVLMIVLFAGIFFLQMGLMAVYQAIVSPLVIRATITQDFKASFDWRFLKNFLALVWKELAFSVLFMLGTSLCLGILAVVTCYIGGILASPVAVFSWHRLQKQLYRLYLARGGEPVPVSPKLNDLPPPLPVF